MLVFFVSKGNLLEFHLVLSARTEMFLSMKISRQFVFGEYANREDRIWPVHPSSRSELSLFIDKFIILYLVSGQKGSDLGLPLMIIFSCGQLR